MLRCPFNGFSKCDGSCPFSTENFKTCQLATNLLTLVGALRGVHEQLREVNSHLVDVSNQIDHVDDLVATISVDVEKGTVAEGCDSPVETERRRDCAEDWVASKGADWFVAKTTLETWNAFVAACINGEAAMQTRMRTNNRANQQNNSRMTQRKLTTIVRRVHPELVAIPPKNGGNIRIFTKVEVPA